MSECSVHYHTEYLKFKHWVHYCTQYLMSECWVHYHTEYLKFKHWVHDCTQYPRSEFWVLYHTQYLRSKLWIYYCTRDAIFHQELPHKVARGTLVAENHGRDIAVYILSDNLQEFTCNGKLSCQNIGKIVHTLQRNEGYSCQDYLGGVECHIFWDP